MTVFGVFFGNKDVPSPSNTDQSDQIIDKLDKELNVKVYGKEKEGTFPVQKITVTSQNAKETIVWGLKPNGKPKEKRV